MLSRISSIALAFLYFISTARSAVADWPTNFRYSPVRAQVLYSGSQDPERRDRIHIIGYPGLGGCAIYDFWPTVLPHMGARMRAVTTVTVWFRGLGIETLELEEFKRTVLPKKEASPTGILLPRPAATADHAAEEICYTNDPENSFLMFEQSKSGYDVLVLGSQSIDVLINQVVAKRLPAVRSSPRDVPVLVPLEHIQEHTVLLLRVPPGVVVTLREVELDLEVNVATVHEPFSKEHQVYVVGAAIAFLIALGYGVWKFIIFVSKLTSSELSEPFL